MRGRNKTKQWNQLLLWVFPNVRLQQRYTKQHKFTTCPCNRLQERTNTLSIHANPIPVETGQGAGETRLLFRGNNGLLLYLIATIIGTISTCQTFWLSVQFCFPANSLFLILSLVSSTPPRPPCPPATPDKGGKRQRCIHMTGVCSAGSSTRPELCCIFKHWSLSPASSPAYKQITRRHRKRTRLMNHEKHTHCLTPFITTVLQGSLHLGHLSPCCQGHRVVVFFFFCSTLSKA